MPKITKLSKEVAELIAAGEVVERPASVVKELIENSIDAGASKITVEIENGGITYIRVADDGCGIAGEDVKTAFVRNATSKIKDAEDLLEIGTLGFRGEALAAAAAVSKIDMLTKTADSEIGTHIHAESGQTDEPRDAGCPNGTTVIVRDLFFNTPARLKFMKRDATEAGYVAAAVAHAALSKPEISFKFIKNGKQELQTPGDGKLLSAIYAVYGREHSFSMIEVCGETEGVTVSGFTAKPENSRANRSMQDFFVNGRYIFSKTLCAALEQAYKERMMVGRYPSCTLNITASPLLFDVNVHPAKTEIKFADERRIFNAVYRAVKSALDGDLSKTSANITNKAAEPDAQIKKCDNNIFSLKQEQADSKRTDIVITMDDKFHTAGAQNPPRKTDVFISGPSDDKPSVFNSTAAVNYQADGNHSIDEYIKKLEQKSPEEPIEISFEDMEEKKDKHADTELKKTETELPAKREEQAEHTDSDIRRLPDETEEMPEFKVVGELLKTYIVIEQGDEVIIIDKHAAHERIIFNEISKNSGESPTQLLLEPYILSLSPEYAALLIQNKDLLDKVGYSLDEFGIGTVAVRQIPVYTSESDIAPILSELAAKLANGRLSKPELLTRIYETIACKAAVKANSFTDEFERNNFAAKLMSMPEIKYCPHGRPVAVKITKYELEKMFKRA